MASGVRRRSSSDNAVLTAIVFLDHGREHFLPLALQRSSGYIELPGPVPASSSETACCSEEKDAGREPLEKPTASKHYYVAPSGVGVPRCRHVEDGVGSTARSSPTPSGIDPSRRE